LIEPGWRHNPLIWIIARRGSVVLLALQTANPRANSGLGETPRNLIRSITGFPYENPLGAIVWRQGDSIMRNKPKETAAPGSKKIDANGVTF
jgi:hypothetical protein